MIRKASVADLQAIVAIANEAKVKMNEKGNFQWNESYPNTEHFLMDIEEGTLYVATVENQIAGVVCINTDQPNEYKTVKWRSDQQHLTIHRLAVSGQYLGKGIGKLLINHAIAVCLEKGLNYIKTDTNALNENAQRLLESCGYEFIGDISLSGKDGRFYCYDKVLSEN